MIAIPSARGEPVAFPPRPALLDADRIVELGAGRVEAMGTHAELLAHGGHHARLFARHARGALADPLGALHAEVPEDGSPTSWAATDGVAADSAANDAPMTTAGSWLVA